MILELSIVDLSRNDRRSRSYTDPATGANPNEFDDAFHTSIKQQLEELIQKDCDTGIADSMLQCAKLLWSALEVKVADQPCLR